MDYYLVVPGPLGSYFQPIPKATADAMVAEGSAFRSGGRILTSRAWYAHMSPLPEEEPEPEPEPEPTPPPPPDAPVVEAPMQALFSDGGSPSQPDEGQGEAGEVVTLGGKGTYATRDMTAKRGKRKDVKPVKIEVDVDDDDDEGVEYADEG